MDYGVVRQTVIGYSCRLSAYAEMSHGYPCHSASSPHVVVCPCLAGACLADACPADAFPADAFPAAALAVGPDAPDAVVALVVVEWLVAVVAAAQVLG